MLLLPLEKMGNIIFEPVLVWPKSGHRAVYCGHNWLVLMERKTVSKECQTSRPRGHLGQDNSAWSRQFGPEFWDNPAHRETNRPRVKRLLGPGIFLSIVGQVLFFKLKYSHRNNRMCFCYYWINIKVPKRKCHVGLVNCWSIDRWW